MTTDEFTLYDAAYVLGALSPADRREFEDHLKGCAACASSPTELAQAAQPLRWSSNSRRSAGDRAPRTYAASYSSNLSVLMAPLPSLPGPGAGRAARSACVTSRFLQGCRVVEPSRPPNAPGSSTQPGR